MTYDNDEFGESYKEFCTVSAFPGQTYRHHEKPCKNKYFVDTPNLGCNIMECGGYQRFGEHTACIFRLLG
jgi:hypothetical protein